MKTFKTFDQWVKNQPAKQKRLISELRKLVADVAPRLEETTKWGNAVWLKNDLPLLFIHAQRDHIQFGFFGGAFLADPKKLLIGKGKFVRHIRIENSDDIDADLFSTMIRKAVRAPAYK